MMKDNMKVMTFGCSFTKYHWPTWADIVLKQAEQYGHDTDNWGLPGVGNLFIAIKVQEAIATGSLKPGDHAFICWSTFMREDRMVNGTWINPGNIFNQSIYSQAFVEEFADLEFYTVRDCALINATRAALQAHGINQTHSIMNVYEVYHNGVHAAYNDSGRDQIKSTIEMFGLKFDCKPVLAVLQQPEIGIPVKWSDARYNDTHQMPKDMLRYVKEEMSTLPIPWLASIHPNVENWVFEWQNKIDSTPKPLLDKDFPLPMSKYNHIGMSRA